MRTGSLDVGRWRARVLWMVVGFVLACFVGAGATTNAIDLWRVDGAHKKFFDAYEGWVIDGGKEIREQVEGGKSLYSLDIQRGVRERWLKRGVSEKFRKLERELGL